MMIELLNHLSIILISIPLSIMISVPLGFYISSRPRLAKIIIYIASILMTVPSLSLFGIMVVILAPFQLGIGKTPAVIAIMIYSLLPIVRNTYIALQQVSDKMIEAAKGIGFTKIQILFKIKIPLSVPVIMAGIRNATVLGISIVTYAFLVGAGGLGYFIFSGINRANIYMVITGALLISVTGIGMNYFFLFIEKLLIPAGLKVKK